MTSVFAEVLSGLDPHSKNVHVLVNGWLNPTAGGAVLDWQCIVSMAMLSAKSLRLDAVNYALSDKLEVLLAWDNSGEGGKPHVFLPLNGRGRLDFDSVNGLKNTVGLGKTGDVLLSAFSELPRRAHFMLTLDFSKQGAGNG